MASIYLSIDASELFALTESMRSKLTPGNFDRLMRRALNEVGKRSKKPIRDAVLREYAVSSAFVNSGIKGARVGGGGGSITCIIPLIGPKGKIGTTFSAGGGYPGWNPPKYRVTAQIVRGGQSTLPPTMASYGGQPPFINTAFVKVAFTRSGKSRGPIEPVAALALPQMPLNRSRAETEEKLMELTEKRVIHHFSGIFG